MISYHPFLRTLQTFRRIYWRIFRPLTIGVRALVVDQNGKILLVKHSYGSGWYLPGGRLRRNESLLHALERELNEEVGITIPRTPNQILGAYSNFAEAKRDHVIVFVVKDWERRHQAHFEIDTQQFFDPEHLPADCTPGTKRRILEYFGALDRSYDW